jgi:uncharacterized protein YndB with AHSA1/START domain
VLYLTDFFQMRTGGKGWRSASIAGRHTNQNKSTNMEKPIPAVEAQMLIRKPIAEVFQAFIDPAITSNFWFTKSSGQLEVGKTTTWAWEMYGISTNVLTKEINLNQNILTEWGNPSTTVDYIFTALTGGATYVVIKNYGFKETGDKLIQVMMDSKAVLRPFWTA